MSPTSRILGLETEYGIIGLDLEGGAEAAARHLFRFRPAGYRGDNLFLTNGSRLYLDIGSHPEYASAECTTVKELVTADRCGEELLSQMAQEANQNWADRGIKSRLHVIKNNQDSQGNTFGCHENYSFPREIEDQVFLPILTSFLALRICLVGSGMLFPLSKQQTEEENLLPDLINTESSADSPTGLLGWRWAFSARAPYMKATTSADPTKYRALVNTRDEPHADREKWRRLHVISGDSNLSEATTALKVGLTAGLLDAIEAGVDFTDLVLANPVRAMNELNFNHFAPVALAAGPVRPAVIVLAEFLERIFANSSLSALGGWAQAVRSLTQGMLAALLAGPIVLEQTQAGLAGVFHDEYQKFLPQIDWLQKRHLVWAMQQRNGQNGLNEVAVNRFQLAFADLDPVTGLGTRLRASGGRDSWLEAADLIRGKTQAPTTTRAAIRGRFLAAALSQEADFAVSWSQIRLDSPPQPPVDLLDPFQRVNPQAEALIRFVLKHGQAQWIDPAGKKGLGAPG